MSAKWYYDYNRAAVLTATIASGGTVSTAVDLQGLTAVGIVIPSAWTTATVTVNVSLDDGATWATAADALGMVYTIQATAGVQHPIDPSDSVGWLRIRLVSSAAQAADRQIKVVARAV